MKRLTAFFAVALLAFCTSAKADTMVVPVNTSWTSLTTISIDFDFPSDATSIKSVTVDISHTFQSDLTFSLNGPGGLYDLHTPQGGTGELGVDGLGLPGDEASYTFVETGGVSTTGAFGLGGGTFNANSWGTGGAAAGWNITIVDDFAGDGGSVSNVTIDFNTNTIPEPTAALAVLALGGVAALRRR